MKSQPQVLCIFAECGEVVFFNLLDNLGFDIVAMFFSHLYEIFDQPLLDKLKQNFNNIKRFRMY
jgi:hypothetical protein